MAAYFAANAHSISERVLRLGSLAVTGPLSAFMGQNDRGLSVRLAYSACRGMTQDRLLTLADEYYENFIEDQWLDQGLELIQQARRQGHRVVLLSEGLEMVMGRALKDLRGVDEVLCNRLEVRNRRATGRLQEPIIAGHEACQQVKKYAQEQQLDLSQSLAYATYGGDMLLLASVGHPCAANPDFTLRRAAREVDWPIVDYNN